MSDLAQSLLSSFDARSISAIAQQLGVSPHQAGSAIETALPLLLGQLSQNAATPQGAQALLGAVQRDHAAPQGIDLGGLLGSVLGGLGGAQQQPQNRAMDGMAILGHIFGGGSPQAAQSRAPQVPGLDGAGSAKLLAILAPLVLSALGKMNSGASANAGGGGLDLGSIAGILGGATRAFGGTSQPQQQQQAASPVSGIFNAVLDQDGDGQVGIGEIFGAAQKLGLFGKR